MTATQTCTLYAAPLLCGSRVAFDARIHGA